MVSIGLMSDTHGNRAFITRALEILVRERGVDKLYHLGDNYVDASLFEDEGVPFLRVPGLYCSEYSDAAVPNKVTDRVEGVRVCLVHAERDLTPADLQDHDLVAVGHSHKFGVTHRDGAVVLNPGHLKSDSDKGRPPTMAVLEIDGKKMKGDFLGLDGKILHSFSEEIPG